ncbi:hypothetical protein M422DRAFT_777944 [Sphaerobolus stellatus SS14]|uniref:Uncharacterized protein n=1 Tax=Sphaerobolus stellatus (strain SS14) TaxID=990650 RepID=A0A0C9UWP5_SPHS4|nr:hypothetical protein M422DRAFT_777944 [Sphaerobolus stellatus SS14]
MSDIVDEGGTAEDVRRILDLYAIVLDYPAAMFPELSYEAYPDAIFILTIRDLAEWNKSVQNTFEKAAECRSNAPSLSVIEKRSMNLGPRSLMVRPSEF